LDFTYRTFKQQPPIQLPYANTAHAYSTAAIFHGGFLLPVLPNFVAFERCLMPAFCLSRRPITLYNVIYGLWGEAYHPLHRWELHATQKETKK
jgi:hypothetical protein